MNSLEMFKKNNQKHTIKTISGSMPPNNSNKLSVTKLSRIDHENKIV